MTWVLALGLMFVFGAYLGYRVGHQVGHDRGLDDACRIGRSLDRQEHHEHDEEEG
jgi:hypothetical protein